MQTSLTFKIHIGDELRRVTMVHFPNWQEFEESLTHLVGTRFSPETHQIRYKDEEGDVISVTSDRELLEAFFVLKNQIARFTVEEVAAPTSSAKAPSDPNTIELDLDLGSNLGETIQNLIQSFQGAYSRRFNPNNNCHRPAPGQTVHHGVTCDGCSTYPIVGNRYKCSVCPDYDLCESCHSQEKHKEHTLNKVESTPVMKCPWARGQHGGQAVHRAICDNCSQRIVGNRYKCNNCEDYDLCEACEKLKVHVPEHTFTQIARPMCPRRFHGKTEEKPKAEEKPEVKTEVKTEEAEKPVEVAKPVEVVVEAAKPEVVKIEEVKPVEVAKPVEIKPEVKPVEEKPVHPFADKIEQLAAMGFVDIDRNIALLAKHKGDLVKTVSDLLL